MKYHMKIKIKIGQLIQISEILAMLKGTTARQEMELLVGNEKANEINTKLSEIIS